MDKIPTCVLHIFFMQPFYHLMIFKRLHAAILNLYEAKKPIQMLKLRLEQGGQFGILFHH
jgi:hypothetical protein